MFTKNSVLGECGVFCLGTVKVKQYTCQVKGGIALAIGHAVEKLRFCRLQGRFASSIRRTFTPHFTIKLCLEAATKPGNRASKALRLSPVMARKTRSGLRMRSKSNIVVAPIAYNVALLSLIPQQLYCLILVPLKNMPTEFGCFCCLPTVQNSILNQLLNHDVKANAVGRKRAKTKSVMIENIRHHLRRCQHHPEVVRRLFHEKHVAYAA